jgi:hypothetical protein
VVGGGRAARSPFPVPGSPSTAIQKAIRASVVHIVIALSKITVRAYANVNGVAAVTSVAVQAPGRQPRSELGRPEYLHQRRADGEVERRLVEVGQAIERGEYVVVALGHLARDLGVAALVGLQQCVASEIEGERQQQQRSGGEEPGGLA